MSTPTDHDQVQSDPPETAEDLVQCPMCAFRPTLMVLKRVITCVLCGGANPRRIPLAMRVEFELLLPTTRAPVGWLTQRGSGLGSDFIRITTELRRAYGIKAEGVP